VKRIYVTGSDEWREWLEVNHEKEKEVWLVFYKKHTGKPTIPYEDAVREAICFGWIDSIVKRIDDETYVQEFTPRTNTRKWSDANKKRALTLIHEGRMTDAGLRKLPTSLENGTDDSGGNRQEENVTLPGHLAEIMRASGPAWENFNGLSNSQRRLYVKWITAAKKEETRKKRLKEAIGLLEQNKKLPMK
jgi:uncharacterized protein YdeI (YjbR/CyaY-like superfamily)